MTGPLQAMTRRVTPTGRTVRAYLRDRWLERRTPPTDLEGREFDVVVFFGGAPEHFYQLRDWLRPLERLDEQLRVVVLCRRASHALQVREQSRLAVVQYRHSARCNAFITGSGAPLVLYVNHASVNFQTMRLSRPAHVHLNHGESDKVAMVSNQLKAYDVALVAGPAARRRVTATLIDFDATRLREIGRPQLDVPQTPPALPATTRPATVLYAPTWEGDDVAMAYGSVGRHGIRIVQSLLADPANRLVYRPHPQTGKRSASTADADRTIRALIDEANATDPDAGHVVDTTSPWGWQPQICTAAVLDVSAVVFDWLATGKPLLITPLEPTAPPVGGSIEQLPSLSAEDVDRVSELLSAQAADAVPAGLVADHFGDTTPGASLDRFVATCVDLAARRRASWRARASADGV